MRAKAKFDLVVVDRRFGNVIYKLLPAKETGFPDQKIEKSPNFGIGKITKPGRRRKYRARCSACKPVSTDEQTL